MAHATHEATQPKRLIIGALIATAVLVPATAALLAYSYAQFAAQVNQAITPVAAVAPAQETVETVQEQSDVETQPEAATAPVQTAQASAPVQEASEAPAPTAADSFIAALRDTGLYTEDMLQAVRSSVFVGDAPRADLLAGCGCARGIAGRAPAEQLTLVNQYVTTKYKLWNIALKQFEARGIY